MSITVACSCGKRFKTGDQNAGRKAKCSACGAVVMVPMPAPVDGDDGLAALASLAGQAEVFQPAAITRPASTPATAAKTASTIVPSKKPAGKAADTPTPAIRMIEIPPLYIILAILAIVIPAALYWVKTGPLLAQRQWTDRSRVAEVQIPDQIVRAMMQYYRSTGLLGEGDSTLTYRPKMFVITFGEPKFMTSLPDRVLFSGRGSEGTYQGHFNPQNMQFEADVNIAGGAHQVTGSASEEDNSVQLDGKEVTVH